MNRQRLFLLLLVTTFRLNAQQLEPAAFDHYTTAHGLSDNFVSSVTQDSTGYLWMGTAWGLNRFNGHRFVQFHPASDSFSLPAEEVVGLTWLDKYRLAATGTGVHILDTRTMRTRNIFIPYHNKKYQFKFNMVMRVKGDAEGNLYVLTRSGFYHYDKTHALISRFDYHSEAAVPVSHFYFGNELLEMDAQRLLITSVGGLYIYDKAKSAVRRMAATDAPLLAELLAYPRENFQLFSLRPGEFFLVKTKADSLVYINLKENKKMVSLLPHGLGSEVGWRSKLFQMNDTSFYLSAQNAGLYRLRFYPRTGRIVWHPQKELKAYLCNALAKDKEGHLLIATDKGLLRQRTERPMVQTARLPEALEEKFPSIYLTDVFASADKLYAGSRGGGVLVFDKKTFRFERSLLFDDSGKSGNHVRSIAVASPNRLLIGTLGALSLLQLNNHTRQSFVPPGWDVPNDWTNDLHRDSKANIWISSHNIYRYNTITGKFTIIPLLPQLLEVPAVIEEDRTGNIWMARHGLARYNILLNKYDLYIDSFPYTRMPDKQVNALVVDAQNTIWFNSANNGLLAYDVTKKTFRHFTRKDGLPDDNVSALAVVGNTIWIGCYSGIACIDTRNFRITNFGKEDGFPDAPIRAGARFFYDSSEHRLYIGFSNAVVRFNPDDVLRRGLPPQTFVETVVVNGKKRFSFPSQAITTPWRENGLNITIGSINFRDGNTQYYAYRVMEAESTPWIYTGTQATFSISGLSPGNHRIQTKVFSAANRWPAQVNDVYLTVTPPFWLTPWFLAAAGIGVLALLYFFIKWRIALAKRKEMVKTQLQKLKADNYKAQFELEQISHYFSTSLAGKKTADAVLWDVAENLIGRLNYEDCVLYLWNETGTKMIQKAAYGPKGRPEVIAADAFDVAPGQGIVGEVIKTGKPVLVGDTRRDLRYRIDDEFRLSEVAVPILHNNELLGVIDSEHSQPQYFTERDVKILSTIATLIANKLKQLQSEQTLEEKQEELAGINEQLAEARLSALQAQMNPHFVFNALNSIKRMILDGDNEQASRYLSKFAHMIRMTLEHSKETFVTLHENIEYIKAYLEMESLRFGDSFAYEIAVDKTIDTAEATIPSMMIQPLVENAIWHGLLQSGGEKKLRLRFSEEEGKLVCVVEDNGIGIRQSEKQKKAANSQHRSVGLDNLRKRIKIMNDKYDTGCSLLLFDLSENGNGASGTRVLLQFNLLNV